MTQSDKQPEWRVSEPGLTQKEIRRAVSKRFAESGGIAPEQDIHEAIAVAALAKAQSYWPRKIEQARKEERERIKEQVVHEVRAGGEEVSTPEQDFADGLPSVSVTLIEQRRNKMDIDKFWLRARDIYDLYHDRYRRAVLTEQEQLRDVSDFLTDMDRLRREPICVKEANR